MREADEQAKTHFIFAREVSPMYRVLYCTLFEHDLPLLLLALFVCSATFIVTAFLWVRQRMARPRWQHAWLISMGVVTGGGVWATHFIAMLAYRSSFPLGFSLWITMLSLILALPWMLGAMIVLLTATLALYVRSRRHAMRLIESEQRSMHMAYHDALTGISNRAHFEDLLADMSANARRTGRSFALHCIDLDRFKELNDTHGHHIGDELLRLVAARLSNVCAKGDACARLGGDEFAILQRVDTDAQASAFGDAIVAKLSEPYELSVGAKTLGCSVGTVLSGSCTSAPLELLRQADLALYRAKEDGRNCHRTYDADMDAVLKTKRLLKDDLRTDLMAGKLSMVYQPQVRLSGEVVGLEALVRWTHGERGPISPSVFIPIAEDSGLIKMLGEFTLKQAAFDSHRWPHLKIAVNVSATQIRDPSFVEQAKRIVKEAGARPSNIEIELTEGVFFTSEEETLATLEALHEAGFSIALDDFGTGYSSLSYLQRFPIDKIKIDRSFVSSLGQDPKADALFTAIVKLATALEMRVIAEGVETNEQWLRLTRAGCPKIQGYIASKPLIADDVQPFINRARASEPPAESDKAMLRAVP